MSRRDDSISLRHMLDYAREGVALAKDRSRADLDILWDILKLDLPTLVDQLEIILPETSSG